LSLLSPHLLGHFPRSRLEIYQPRVPSIAFLALFSLLFADCNCLWQRLYQSPPTHKGAVALLSNARPPGKVNGMLNRCHPLLLFLFKPEKIGMNVVRESLQFPPRTVTLTRARTAPSPRPRGPANDPLLRIRPPPCRSPPAVPPRAWECFSPSVLAGPSPSPTLDGFRCPLGIPDAPPSRFPPRGLYPAWFLCCRPCARRSLKHFDSRCKRTADLPRPGFPALCPL